MFVPNPFQVNLLRADAIMANDNIWAYWKQHALPNVCPKDYWSLGETARRTLKRMRRRPRLITAFWQHAQLSF